MHAERGWLVEHVFPDLEERLRERHCHLEVIDLRWGVETTAEEEQAKEKLGSADRILRSWQYTISVSRAWRHRPFPPTETTRSC